MITLAPIYLAHYDKEPSVKYVKTATQIIIIITTQITKIIITM
jgi:hypothetical protein